MFSLMSFQPDEVRRSYWIRHRACAVDVLELLVVEFAATHVEGSLVAESDQESMLYKMNVMLKDTVYRLMGDQYVPGER